MQRLESRSTFFPLLIGALTSTGCGASASHESSGAGPPVMDGGGGAGSSGSTASDTGKLPDVPCGLHTNYPGDENCIEPPDPSLGIQLHIGPSDYDDPDVVAAKDANGNYLWLMMPGGESTDCYHAMLPNEESFYYFQTQYRMRTGSHHMILRSSNNTDPTPGWGKCNGSIVNAIGGTQHVIEDFPPNGEVAPEDEGLGHQMTAHAIIDAQLHFFNTGDTPRMREVWVNYIYKPADEVSMNLGMLGALTAMNVPPHSTATISGACKAEQAISAGMSPRIVSLFGHAHVHNKRFLVNHVRVDGTSEAVYDSYDGAEAPSYVYNTLVQLPTADPTGRVSGGRSGLLVLNPGESLNFSCDVVNDTDNTFHGLNEVNTDEMCHLFGSVAGLGFPCFL